MPVMATPIPRKHWRVVPGVPLDREVVRVFRGECRWLCGFARTHDDAAAVHRIRQAIKRLRAVNRLFRKVLGKRRQRLFDRTLRDIGRALSANRDADVLRTTLSSLSSSTRMLPLRLSGPRGRAPVARPAIVLAIHAVGGVERRWRLAVADALQRRPLAEEVVMRALQKSHRRAQRQHTAAARNANPTALHELRKRVKVLHTQVELLLSVWAPEQRPRVRLALSRWKRLAKWLGEGHDLEILLAATRAWKPTKAVRALRAKASRRQRSVHRRSLILSKSALSGGLPDFSAKK